MCNTDINHLLFVRGVLPGLLNRTGLVIHGADVKEGGVLPLQLLDAEVLHDMGAGLLTGVQACSLESPIEPDSLGNLEVRLI